MSWQQRRVFVTGATGIVGSWLVKRLLQDRRLRRRRSCATGIRRANSLRSGDIERTSPSSTAASRTTARSGTRDQRARDRHGVPPRRTADRVDGAAQPAADVRGQHPRHLQPARGVPRAPGARQARRRGQQRQGLRRRRRCCPTPRTCPLNGRHPYDVSKSCTDLLALSYAHTYDCPSRSPAAATSTAAAT